jgi:hypothetical protein
VNWPWLATAAAGAVVLGLAVVGATGPTIPAWERRLFGAINGWPAWCFVPLWPVMQLGNLAVGAAAGLVVAAVAGEWDVAVGVVLATGGKLVVEKLLRRELHGSDPARANPAPSSGAATSRGAAPASPPATPCSWPRWRVSSPRSCRPGGSCSPRSSRCW